MNHGPEDCSVQTGGADNECLLLWMEMLAKPVGASGCLCVGVVVS